MIQRYLKRGGEWYVWDGDAQERIIGIYPSKDEAEKAAKIAGNCNIDHLPGPALERRTHIHTMYKCQNLLKFGFNFSKER